MSVTRILSIHCDGCGAFAYSNIGERAADVRSSLRRDGWRVNVGGDGRMRLDFCARCADQRSRSGASAHQRM